jgi:hypothetical protein
MRRAAIISVAAMLVAGCAHARPATTTTAPSKPKHASAGLLVGVVGSLEVSVPGARVERGSLGRVAADRLVLVSAASDSLATVSAAADANPGSHFVLVGGSTKGAHRPNLVGLVLRDDQAALLGGTVAGLVANEHSGQSTRVAWVGPQERSVTAAFARGVHSSAPSTHVLRAYSRNIPARCKEAALGAIARGAVVVMAHGGPCFAAATDGAHQQEQIALGVTDFELPAVAADVMVRDAVAGIFHGGEDIVFGASSGAIAVRGLDPLVSPAIAVRARAAAQELASGLRPTG